MALTAYTDPHVFAAGQSVGLAAWLNELGDNTKHLKERLDAPLEWFNSGAAVTSGALMIQDTGADNTLKRSTASAGQAGPFWVALESIATGAQGTAAAAGYAYVNFTGTAPMVGDRLQASATAGVAQVGTTNSFARALTIGVSGQVLAVLDGPAPAAAGGGGAGTVTSAGLALPSEFTVTNSPVTTTGTLTGAWATGQTAARVLATDPASASAVALRQVSTAHIATGGQVTETQLDYQAITDVLNGVALSVSTWTDVVSAQNFTVDDANSTVLIGMDGFCWGQNTDATAWLAAARLNVDNGAVVRVVFGQVGTASSFATFFGGGVIGVTGLTAGAHTVRPQIFANHATTAYCRAAGPPEALAMYVWELKR